MKPNDIPQDVWDSAEDAFDTLLCNDIQASGTAAQFRIDSITPLARAIMAEREANKAKIAALEREAVQWKGEAMAHKSSLHEAYQVLTGATGEPANWNGARPFRQFKEADQQAFVEWLRAWVRMKFGKIITFQTAYGARMSFTAERSQLVRDTLAATAIRKGQPN